MILKHKLTTIMVEPAFFSHYQEGKLYYNIWVAGLHSLTTYRFPIDLTDPATAKGRFGYKEKGIMFLRWFKLAMEQKTLVIEHDASSEGDGGVSPEDGVPEGTSTEPTKG